VPLDPSETFVIIDVDKGPGNFKKREFRTNDIADSPFVENSHDFAAFVLND
jgi:hypothetical protein